MNDSYGKNAQSLRAIDLFCGIGGNSLGARDAGIESIAGFDLWDLAIQVYQDNFKKARVYPYKLQEVDPKVIKSEIGDIDLILASPECTSHSVARGNRARIVHSLELGFQVIRFAEIFKPRWIMIENVPHMRNWDRYDEFIKELQKLGYQVKEQVLIASDFGVPQSRKRLFILCDNREEPPEIFPPQNIILKTARNVVDLNGSYKMTPLDNGRRATKTINRAKRGIAEIGSDIPFLMVYYGSSGTGNGGWQSLDIPLRTITTLDRFALVKPGENGHMMRMLQVPELKAAMGFSPEFILNRGTRREKIHMLGNAVCPPLITIILKKLTGFQIKGVPEFSSNTLV
jgi:DNA (cytosine-5)-methyltransferase 1